MRAGPTIYGPTMAAGYDRGRLLPSADIDKWISAARPYLPSPGGRLLDLGAGTGRFTGALARSGGAVVACEPSPAMRTALRENHPGAVVVGGAAEAVPFRAGAFDAVWASQVVHHVPDLPGFAAAMRHVLRPGGHLLIRGGFGPVEELVLYRFFPLAWAPGTPARLTLPDLAGVLSDAGFALTVHVQVEQTFAGSADELVEKVRTRSLSPLAGLPDPVFQDGLSALVRDAAEGPFVERLDLVVFRSGAGQRNN